MAITEIPPRRGTGLSSEDIRAKRALDFLATISGRIDEDIANAAGMSRESFRARRRADTRISLTDIPALANALGVGSECFTMDELELVEWIRTDERGRDLLTRSFRCILLLAS